MIAWSFLGVAGFLGLIALGLVVGGLVCLGIALISVVLPAVVGGGEEAWITGGALGFSLAVTGVSLIAPGVSMVPFVVIPGWIGRRMLARARQNVELHDRGVEVQAEVVSVRATGAKVDGVPQYRIELRIPRDLGEPATHTAELPLTPLSYRRLQPGATLPVLVHPDDPSRVHLQL